jgi:hypothetical protein
MRRPAAGDEEADLRVARVGRREERLDVAAHGGGVELEAQARGGALHAREVVVERERPAAVEPDDLEDAVAAQQPFVGDGEPRLRGVEDLPVQASYGHGRRV